MSTSVSANDPYRRRREAGMASREQTRQRLLAAADELFLELGYQRTSVAAIATRAGVSLQTLYLAWGSKRALLSAAADAAAVNAQLPMTPDEWHVTVRAELAKGSGEPATAAAYLGAVSTLFTRVARRAAPYWQIHRQAAAVDPEIAADWDALTARRRQTMAVVAHGIPTTGLRSGLGMKVLTDTLWALASPNMWELLVDVGDYRPAAFQRWLGATLVAALCEAREAS